MDSRNIPQTILGDLYLLKKEGFDAYLVGGCVRDLFLNKTPKDWDITTNAIPEEIQKIFPDSFYDNAYGTVSVKHDDVPEGERIVQITPYRTEAGYSDNRRPDSVSFSKDIHDDLKRRDFTINALAWDPIKDSLIDDFEGVKDIHKKVVRAVGDARERFDEDGLRLLRAVRFATVLQFEIEKETGEALKEKSNLLKNISIERIRDEFEKIIMSDHPAQGMQELLRTGLLQYIVPELIDAVGVEQNQAHAFDVWTHLIKSLQHGADKKMSLEIRLAALLHDIGKPVTRERGTKKNDWTFYNHEMVGAKIAKEILRRLKFSEKIVSHVGLLIRWHMFFSDTEQITLSAVRRMVATVGVQGMSDLMQVRRCDRIGTGRPKESPYRLRKYEAMVEEVLRDPISVSSLKIDGNDLMQKLHIAPGPKIGFILHALLENVLDDPQKNNESYLIEKADELSKLDDAKLRAIGESARKEKERKEAEEVQLIRQKYGVR